MYDMVLDVITLKSPCMSFRPTNRGNKESQLPKYEAVAMSLIILVLSDLFGFTNDLEL